MHATKNLNKMKYYLLTMGCQMNKSDSERIEGLLLDMGMRAAGKPEGADLIILNTCSVRQTAEDRVYGLIRNFNRLKAQKPHLLVAVTGCVAGRDKDGKIRAKMPGVDFFFPISDLPRLPELIFSRWRNKTVGHLVSYSYPQVRMDYLGVKPKVAEWWRGWVVIQTGCSNYCTYCVVPYARGHEKNRPVSAILKEVREMIHPVKSAKGSKQFNRVKNAADPTSPFGLREAREIQLLGQTVNSWQASDPQNFSKNNPFLSKKYFTEFSAVAPNSVKVKTAKDTELLTAVNNSVRGDEDKKSDFAALLWEINQILGINRVGFASAHPMYMTDATIKAMKLPKMMNYLHLPVQSGNDEILKKMNREYTREEYLKVIHMVKKARPTISLATDIIVGFPGETKKQFADTAALYKKCDFDLSYTAMYSPRTGTAAYRAFPDDVPREEKRRRWRVLQCLMEKTVLRKNKKFVDKIVEVLVDGCDPYSLIRTNKRIRNKRISGKCWGFSREYKKVSFPGNKSLIGQVVNVKIKKAKEWELEGEIVK